MDEEIDFFVRHIAGGVLNEEDASKRKEQAKAIGYNSRAMIFGGGKDVLVCIPKAREAKIVKNVARSIGFLEIEMTLSKLRKRKLSQSFTYTNIKGLMLIKALKLQQDMEDAENEAIMLELQSEVDRLQDSFDKRMARLHL